MSYSSNSASYNNASSSSPLINNNSYSPSSSVSSQSSIASLHDESSHIVDRTIMLKENEIIADAERKIAEVNRLKAIQIAEVERERLEKMKAIIAATETLKQSERLIQVAEMKKIENQKSAEQALKEAEILRQAAAEREALAAQHHQTTISQTLELHTQAEQQRLAALRAVEAVPVGMNTSGGVMSKITDINVHHDRHDAIIGTSPQTQAQLTQGNANSYTRSA